jgi:hypothetical protein
MRGARRFRWTICSECNRRPPGISGVCFQTCRLTCNERRGGRIGFSGAIPRTRVCSSRSLRARIIFTQPASVLSTSSGSHEERSRRLVLDRQPFGVRPTGLNAVKVACFDSLHLGITSEWLYDSHIPDWGPQRVWRDLFSPQYFRHILRAHLAVAQNLVRRKW